MKNKVEAQKDFEDNIKNNQLNCWKQIEQHAPNYQKDCYDRAIINDAFTIFFSTKQQQIENFQEYTKRFMVAKDMLQVGV